MDRSLDRPPGYTPGRTLSLARVRALGLPLGALLASIVTLGFPSPAPACTLMAAAGPTAAGSILVAKTRDRRVRFPQVLVDVHDAGTWRYLGIAGDKDGIVTSGINEKGLIVVSAKVSSRDDPTPFIIAGLLAHAASVDEAVQSLHDARRPSYQILMLGDPGSIATVETTAKGRVFVDRRSGGWLVHTNHFRSGPFGELNTHPPGLSSVTRLTRAASLLGAGQARGPITPALLMAICRDHGAAPGERSICRHSELDGLGGGTLSAAVFQITPSGEPRAWVCLGQPCVTPFVSVSFRDPIPPRLQTPHLWLLSELRRKVRDRAAGPGTAAETVPAGAPAAAAAMTSGANPATAPGVAAAMTPGAAPATTPRTAPAASPRPTPVAGPPEGQRPVRAFPLAAGASDDED